MITDNLSGPMLPERSSFLLSLAVLGALAGPAAASQAASLRPSVSAGVERALDATPDLSEEDGIMEARGSRTRIRPWRWGGDPSPSRPAPAPTAKPAPQNKSSLAPKAYAMQDNRSYRVGGNLYMGAAAAQAALAAFVPETLIDDLARSQYDAFMRTHEILPPDERLRDELHQIVRRLMRSNPSFGGFGDWQLEVVHDDSVANAWCMPGMRMTIFTGLLERLGYDRPDLVAAVLAHEMVHAELRHGYSHIRTRLLANAAFTAALGQTRTTAGAIATALGGNLLSTLTMAHVSREDEDEADERAVHILRAAGYDPSVLATALLRLDRSHGTATTGPWDRHEAISERVGNIRRIIANLE